MAGTPAVAAAAANDPHHTASSGSDAMVESGVEEPHRPAEELVLSDQGANTSATAAAPMLEAKENERASRMISAEAVAAAAAAATAASAADVGSHCMAAAPSGSAPQLFDKTSSCDQESDDSDEVEASMMAAAQAQFDGDAADSEAQIRTDQTRLDRAPEATRGKSSRRRSKSSSQKRKKQRRSAAGEASQGQGAGAAAGGRGHIASLTSNPESMDGNQRRVALQRAAGESGLDVAEGDDVEDEDEEEEESKSQGGGGAAAERGSEHIMSLTK